MGGVWVGGLEGNLEMVAHAPLCVSFPFLYALASSKES